MSKWSCGHGVVPKFFRNDILGVAMLVEFTEDNPKKLCYDCWAKERGLPYDKKRLGEEKVR